MLVRSTLSSVVCLVSVVMYAAAAEPVNLLRNGSFEGGKRYWFDTQDKEVVRGDAAHGEFALRIPAKGIQSAAFELKQGVPVTISFSAKAEAPTTIGWQCTPCAREVAMQHKLTWGMKGHHPVKLTTEWKRYTFTFTPNVAPTGLWPRPTYMMQFGDGDKPWLIDAITVAYNAGQEKYLPYRPVEAQVDCPDLRGYRDESANLLEHGQTIRLVGSVSNPGTLPRKLTLRWQLIDYEGQHALGEPVEKQVEVPAGKTLSETAAMRLSPKGLVLGRFSAIDGGETLDRSDIPLCSLPYPKAGTKPHWQERFGGSLWGPNQARQYQKLGFAWTRWHPHMNWKDHQPNGPDAWVWFDKQLDMLESFGVSTHAVLYGKPKWAFASEKEQLPKDMQWLADDPRWDDLRPQCGWDRFIIAAVEHYKGRSLIYEIENEPELDHWDNSKDLYAKFTIRTARLIKQTDPKARVMVDNVYGIPSGLNRHMLQQGGGKYIDVISWHDYHEGWLADGTAIRRMRNALDDLGCKHIEIWFNEGWAYTNTVVDEPAVALTNHTSAQSTNAMVDCVAEMTCAGQEKTILFHTGYETHGMSFWDYYGPGTMLWDCYGYPLPLLPAWNVVTHHLGLSKPVAFVRPPNANVNIFEDVRNGRGVMVAYADRGATADVTVDLPLADLIAEDAMGNAAPLATQKLVLAKTGRPVFLYTASKTSGKQFAEKLDPLDRKHASFVSSGGANYSLPGTWEGTKKDTSDGNPALAGGKPIWRLDQVWPADPKKPENYRPLVWRDGWWLALEHTFGGQPKVEMKDSAIRLEFRAPHNNSPGEKICGLAFIAPQAGTYRVGGTAALKLWEGGNPVRLTVLHKTKNSVVELSALKLTKGEKAELKGISATLAAGDELVLLPRIEGLFNGGDIMLRDLSVSVGSDKPTYRLPAAWQGVKMGTPEGNPIKQAGRAVWRLDQVWPDDPTKTEYYKPLPWSGTSWHPEKNDAGGQPDIKVDNGTIRMSVRGSWTKMEGQRIAGLAFLAPKTGTFRASGTVHTKPWEGGAKNFRLGLFKKDTQRAILLKTVEMPRDDTPVAFEVEADMTEGHELVFMPLMPDWHNATTIVLENLVVDER